MAAFWFEMEGVSGGRPTTTSSRDHYATCESLAATGLAGVSCTLAGNSDLQHRGLDARRGCVMAHDLTHTVRHPDRISAGCREPADVPSGDSGGSFGGHR